MWMSSGFRATLSPLDTSVLRLCSSLKTEADAGASARRTQPGRQAIHNAASHPASVDGSDLFSYRSFVQPDPLATPSLALGIVLIVQLFTYSTFLSEQSIHILINMVKYALIALATASSALAGVVKRGESTSTAWEAWSTSTTSSTTTTSVKTTTTPSSSTEW